MPARPQQEQQALPVPTIAQAYPLLHADLERLIAAPDLMFEAGFSSFVSRLEAAFRAEEDWIEQLGVDSLKEHRELHAEVLRLMHHALARNLAGDSALARKVLQLLPSWFNTHIPRVDEPLQRLPATTRKGTTRRTAAPTSRSETHPMG